MSQAWRRVASASALAVVVSLAAFAPVAQALSLGRLTVQSALGEPLRAEIDIPELTTAEANSLQVGLARAEVYRAAGVDFNAALANTDITLARRPDGQADLRIANPRIVNEPYLDLILEASWASGRNVRDNTMHFDPPNLRVPAPALLLPPVTSAPAAPVRPAPVAAQAPTPAPPPPRPAPPQAPPAATQPAPAAPIPAPAPAPSASPAAAAPVRSAEPTASTPLPAAATRRPAAAQQPPARTAAPQPDTLTVKRGDTAGRIAESTKPANATLEQMLVAMLRANPDAFISNNVNRLKAGAVLELPDDDQVQAVPANQARQLIAAQSRDFNAFRQRLAAAAPAAAAQTSTREATGRIQADVADKRPTATAADQLKLTKGAVATPDASLPEQKIAQARQAQELADRSAELARNISDLTKLGAAAAPAAAPTGTSGPAQTIAAATPVAAEPTPPAEAAAPTATPAGEPATPAEAPPAPTEAPPPAPPAEPPAPAAPPTPAEPPPPPSIEEPGLLDSVMDNPLVLPAAGGLIALLLGLGAYRIHQRKKKAGVDSSFLESRLQPDSFFGASGGQNIDTAEAAATGSSMMYSPSQLDVGGDVDPVAEADVYLAYGRDLQAEEILKEAMRMTPKRVAIHSKMLEIYAKRRDVKGFEVLASEVYALTQGVGPEWAHACALGQELDPANPMYQPGGSPAHLAAAATVVQEMSPGMANTQPFEPSAFDLPADNAAPTPDAAQATPPSLDLDLDFSIDAPEAGTAAVAAPGGTPTDDPNALNFDLDLDVASAPPLAASPAPAADSEPSFDLDMPDLAFDLPSGDEPPPSATAVSQPASDGGMDDLGLDFDFGDEPTPAAPPPTAASDAAVTDARDAAPSPAPYERTAASPAGDGMLDFDMDDLSLDLDATDGDTAGLDDIPDGDPLETKLSLAAEFLAIGDQEGARSLAEEVLAEASGPLRAKANSFLSSLG
ncbi:MAG: FimV/HubP family polar landmark protein [Burkholderiaceae bacterium]|nr:FimV/HubP family polar landmark protein [Burkholderiaceae bacterium]